jgi:hypothetical protein
LDETLVCHIHALQPGKPDTVEAPASPGAASAIAAAAALGIHREVAPVVAKLRAI